MTEIRWWWVAALVPAVASMAMADGKRPMVKPTSQTYADLFKLGKTWKLAGKHWLVEDSELHTRTSRVSCKVTASTTVGEARRSEVVCEETVRGRQPSELHRMTLVGTNAAIWLVPETITDTQIAALDPERAWITAPPTKRSWTEHVPVSGSSNGSTQVRSSLVVPWGGGWCLLVREPDHETVFCVAPGKGLVGVRDHDHLDGVAFGKLPTMKQADRWK